MQRDDGGPAFPTKELIQTHKGESFETYSQGMTLRDWFAGQALAGMVADPNQCPEGDETHEEWCEDMASSAYGLADAMLAERSK